MVLVGGNKEMKAVVGDRGMIRPDDATRAAIRRDRANAIGFFRVCIDENGNVDWVATLKSTGYASYDRKITVELQQQKYTPLIVDGQPVSVCTTEAFQYGYR